MSLCVSPALCAAGGGPVVAIDLDRNTAGVQDQILDFTGGSVVQGAVVVTGAETDTVADYTIELALARTGGAAAVNCTNTSFSEGEVTSNLGTVLCGDNILRKARLFISPGVALGADGVLVVFNFDAELMCNDGESIEISFTSTTSNPQLGISVNGTARGFGAGSTNEITTMTATVRCGEGGGEVACMDSGYYVLDALGGRHHVGSPATILGSLYYGRAVAEDMEKTYSSPAVKGNVTVDQPDLAVLDTFGAVQFVANPSDTPGQTFYWPEGSDPDCGYAVDVEVTSDFDGFWVLTENGGIYRAGTALPDGESAALGNDAADLCNILGIPFGGEVPRIGGFPTDDGASIRAVGFVVVRSGDAAAPTGFVVLDSQGGHYIYDGSGNTLSDGTDGSILNGATAYPFFPGLDIARDIELPVALLASKAFVSNDPTAGLVIYDGWGGVHPVPVSQTANSQVYFLNNDGLTTVGLPYVQSGFDDPSTTGVDESDDQAVGIDVGSIFKDVEFCASGSEGVYVMDGFGGVFAYGSTRSDANSLATMFTGTPYFFPNIYAKDLEATTLIDQMVQEN
ncbi:MAG: hypothetical protein H6751_08390 [Candidatus Omnitrophica bacterium]|nr:hypothetical protein [Candidatus Omnitrophota bacterium]MCB9782966.1 hypothetical protein [Candidatus Omnitrophota bacterium]